MNYEEILGFMAIGFIALFGFMISIKKYMTDERKPLDQLNENIVRLNENIKNMAKADEIRDRRISEHGKEIEQLQKKAELNTYKIEELHREVKKYHG